jgi:hypothetical protein
MTFVAGLEGGGPIPKEWGSEAPQPNRTGVPAGDERDVRAQGDRTRRGRATGDLQEGAKAPRQGRLRPDGLVASCARAHTRT